MLDLPLQQTMSRYLSNLRLECLVVVLRCSGVSTQVMYCAWIVAHICGQHSFWRKDGSHSNGDEHATLTPVRNLQLIS